MDAEATGDDYPVTGDQRRLDVATEPGGGNPAAPFGLAVKSPAAPLGHRATTPPPQARGDGTNLVLYVWYDNEYGYSCQVVRVLERMAGTHPAVVPPRAEVRLLEGATP